MAVNFVQGLLSRSSKGKIPLNLFDKSLFLSSFHTTNATYRGKRKVKVLKPPRLVQMIENGASDEEVQNFINMRDAKRKVTAAYKSKMEEVAELFREQFRIEEERKKDIQGEQMRKEAEEKEQAARNLAIILKSNEELQRERELRNLFQAERKQKEDEAKLMGQMEKERMLFEKRQKIVLQAIDESADFVTKENLEEKIAFALENEVNYNFAINPKGEKLYSTKPPGNFSEHGWKGPSPAAFQLGGYRFGEWDFIFEKKYATTTEKEEPTDSNLSNESSSQTTDQQTD